MKRKLLTALLAVAILALLPATALADDIFADGNGTENDPYIIETVEEACAVHGVDVDKLLALVNEEANKEVK